MCISCSGITQSVQRILLQVQRYRNAIRKQMIKDTFSEKILAFAKQKDEAIKNMRQITNELVAEFENDLRCRNPGRYKMAGKVLEDELEMGISFDTKVLEQLADKLFALRDLIPEQGRIAYQLLPQDCKEMTDQLVEFLLSEVPEIRKCFDCYVDAKYKLSELYATDNKWLKSQKEKYEKEAKKILANRILSGVKTICRLEKEGEGRRLSCKTSGVFGIKDHNGGYGYAGAGCIGTGRSI